MVEIQSLLKLGEYIVRQEGTVGLQVDGGVKKAVRSLIAEHTKYFSERELDKVIALYY